MTDSSANTTVEIKSNIIWRIVIALAILSITILSLRLVFTQIYASTDSIWSFTINLQFEAEGNDTVVKLSPPSATINSRLIRQSLNHPYSTIRYSKNKFDGKTIIAFMPDKAGKIDIDAEFLIHISEHPRIKFSNLPLNTEAREKYLSDSNELDIQHHKITDFLNELQKTSDDKKELVEAISRYVRTYTVSNLSHPPSVRSASETIGEKKITVAEQANLFVALSRAAKIPARIVTGFIFREQPDIQPHYWAEVYFNESWHSFDLYNGYKYKLPSKYVPFRYNSLDIVSISNGKNLEANFDLIETRYKFIPEKEDSSNVLFLFDLSRLSQDTRNVLATLFLLPLGVLITVIFRHFIGIQNYGVFTPSLLALALTRNDLFTTTITLSIIIFFVIMGRVFFPKKMNRTPRLAVIFTLVIMSTGLAVSFVDLYYPAPEGFAVLLPVIILSSLVDNFYKILDTKGKHVAMVRLFWTAVITVFCIPVLRWEALGHQLVSFPEIHLFTLASILLFTIYKGKQLVTLVPKSLRENRSKVTDSSSDAL
ncbi:MAG: 7TM domain-containing protein [Gammaproteobacteria bacterium]